MAGRRACALRAVGRVSSLGAGWAVRSRCNLRISDRVSSLGGAVALYWKNSRDPNGPKRRRHRRRSEDGPSPGPPRAARHCSTADLRAHECQGGGTPSDGPSRQHRVPPAPRRRVVAAHRTPPLPCTRESASSGRRRGAAGDTTCGTRGMRLSARRSAAGSAGRAHALGACSSPLWWRKTWRKASTATPLVVRHGLASARHAAPARPRRQPLRGARPQLVVAAGCRSATRAGGPSKGFPRQRSRLRPVDRAGYPAWAQGAAA